MILFPVPFNVIKFIILKNNLHVMPVITSDDINYSFPPH